MNVFVGIRGRNIPTALAKSPFAARKVLREANTAESATFLEQDSATVPNFAYRIVLSCGNLVGACQEYSLLSPFPWSMLQSFFIPHEQMLEVSLFFQLL